MPSPASVAAPRRSTLKLWLILAVCAAPVVASFVAYFFWRPSAHVNYGDLLAPRLVSDIGLRTVEGNAFRWSDLRGRWVLLTIDSGRCDERCRTNLVYTRQVRLAQGKDSDRVERVWLLTDDAQPAAIVLTEQPGLRVVRASGAEIVSQFPALRSPAEHIYVMDPAGRLMMRFPAEPDPRRILRDVARLLRHSPTP